jgi:hypothetical protein
MEWPVPMAQPVRKKICPSPGTPHQDFEHPRDQSDDRADRRERDERAVAPAQI